MKYYLKEIICEGLDWIHVAQDRNQCRVLVNTAMNLRVTLKAGNILTSRTRMVLPHGVTIPDEIGFRCFDSI
jgi:hypothetical protein